MNIGEWISKRAHLHPEKPFLKDEDGRKFSNKEFDRRVNRMANALTSMGIVQGERVAALMLNSSEFLEIFFACGKTGVIMVPINFRLAVPELIYILKDCTPQALIYSSEFADKIRAVKTSGLSISRYFRHGGNNLSEDSLITHFVSPFPTIEPVPEREITLNDPLFIMYTSGTTGDPKGAIMSHGNILFGAIHSLVGYGVDKTYKSLVVAPLFHIGALAASTTPVIYAGGSLVLKSFYNASEVIKLIMEEKINYMFAVPVMFQMMTKSEEWNNADFSHVHFFISGGAPIPIPVIRKYQEDKGIGFVQGYGLTETGRLTSLDLEDSIRKAGSVGKEVFHITLRIVDQNDRDVTPGEPGEIVVQGPNVFIGYWNKPTHTAMAMRAGWFHTDDLGRRDEEGFIYVIGRKQELIISSGENIYPAEVQRAIQTLPQVREAAAVAMPDPARGEVVAAFVMLHEGQHMTEEFLINSLQGKIAPFKIPKRVFFVEDFPRNSTGKILVKELKKQFTGETILPIAKL
ncbi:MAG TPA: o-succinylbenzoate--CoA ligase [Syntrophaceae bacterium]|jgi:fatty-acyl-CoA synthase|nr:o-succinylbenzoate--CoA ligase [Syntrophaceae bacterium]